MRASSNDRRSDAEFPATVALGPQSESARSLDEPSSIEGRRILARVREALVGDPERPVELGRYTVLDKIGTGGLGVVYSAYDPELKRKVAVKLLRPERDGGSDSESSGLQARIWREAQAMARLSHRNVVDVYDVGTFEGRVFIAMELVDGESLRAWLERERRNWADILDVFVSAGRGLAAAHQAGLVHRDFKPDNVMIDREGRVKVLDFGLARPTSDVIETVEDLRSSGTGSAFALPLTVTGAVMGTPAYMAPEQHLGEPADARSDQFAFCVALHEAVHGRRPFLGDDVRSLGLAKVRGEQVAPTRSITMPSALRRVIARGLAAKPEHRWPSMDALLQALAQLPSSRRRTVWAWVAGTAIATSAAAVAIAPDGCDGDDSRLSAIWNDARADELAAAFGTETSTQRAETWERVERGLEEYADDWLAARADTCTARASSLDLQLMCLDARLDELDALVDVLAEARGKTVRNAVKAMSGLSPVAQCSDASYLGSRIKPPADEATAARVQGLRARLAHAAALRKTARFAEGLEVVTSVVEDAETVDYPPVMVEARLALAFLQEHAGDYATARTTMEDVYYRATSIGYDERAFSAARALVYIIGYRQANREEGLAWSRHAYTVIHRASLPAVQEAWVLESIGAIYKQEGRFAEALPRYQRALELRESLDPEDELALATSISNLGAVLSQVGRLDEGLAMSRRALRIRERALGPNHLSVGTSASNVAQVLRRLGHTAEAYGLARRALEIIETELGPDHVYVVGVANNLGGMLADENRFDEALALFTRALGIVTETFGPDHPHVIDTVSSVARVLRDSGRLDQAIPYAERAQALADEVLPAGHLAHAGPLELVGGILADQGDPRAAVPYLERALEIQVAAHEPSHPLVTASLMEIGITMSDAGRHAEAVAHLERALASAEMHAARPKDLAITRFWLAQALWEAGYQRPRALALARLARVTDPGILPEAVAEIDRWLAPRERRGSMHRLAR